MFRRISSAAATRPMATMAHPLTSAVQFQSVTSTHAAVSCIAMRGCSSTSGTSSGDVSSTKGAAFSASRLGQRAPSINCVTLVGVVHDIQTGYVFEDAVTQFTLTTTSLDAANQAQECVVEKDHHTVRCYGDVFSREVRAKLSEGNVVCVNGRLRLNPQMEPSCNKYYYFPYIQVQPPHGQVSVVYGDRRSPPSPVNVAAGELNNGNGNSTNSGGPAENGDASVKTQRTP
ncbi:putative MP18 RNA editing complex protein [Leishmania mexicana MHOM/GT/2001/U1103]|uniref:MP18 RNA editing complex protein n=1 Tax=Leishmania mexicana (strain MHOM/GT/2001/U1103) TaxID=929439 RepID=E9ASJ0_LEIMU|nr:putative MP18 RNA editing complex protein [Leishmania mexicana MHOM/GT/2001/U1103]CBZ25913.1 putative MP18 RNA editing complex protein [Leishmania mexicana MHOM/GT/2001/U1103]